MLSRLFFPRIAQKPRSEKVGKKNLHEKSTCKENIFYPSDVTQELVYLGRLSQQCALPESTLVAAVPFEPMGRI